MHRIARQKLEWRGYQTVKKNFEDMCNRLGTIPACDRQTDGQTVILPRHSPRGDPLEWLTFGGDPDPHVDSGPFFHFLHHCGIGICGHLLAFLIQSTADFYCTWQNN